MKPTPVLVNALVSMAEAAVIEARGRSFRDRLAADFASLLETYRPGADDFGGGLRRDSVGWSGTRRPNATRVLDRLKDLEISQAELGRRLGISRAAVSKALRSDGWSYQRARRWARALGMRADDLIEVRDTFADLGGSSR